MKQKIFIIGFFVVLAIVAIIKIRPNSSQQEGVASEQYRLIVLAGDVTLKRSGAADVAVTDTIEVMAGDQITTSVTGRARLRWPNGTLTTIEEDSKITISELSDGGSRSRIELIFGDMWSRVTRILGSGEYYEVQTQDTVAAVRGTTFRTTYRNRKARVQTLESKVRVVARRADGTTDDSTAVDVTADTQADFDGAAPARRIALRKITSEEFRERVIQRILRERDLRDDEVRGATDSPAPSASSSPVVTVRPTVSVTIVPTPVRTSTPTPTPTPVPSLIPTLSPLATPTPTPTPSLEVSLNRLLPSAINAGETFVIEGSNFISGRNISQIAGVTVGGQAALDFAIIDSADMFVTPAQIGSGVFDVVVTTKTGSVLTLKGALTIR
jgi:hypothetical protein